MEPWQPIDIYCERIDTTLLSEPLNAASNIAFFIAAWFAWRLYKRENRSDRSLLLLIGLLVLIGIGSTLFHTFANVLTQWADVVPIMLFVGFALWLLARRLLRYDYAKTTALFAVLFILAQLTTYLPWRMNGSVAYLPCLALLIYIGVMLKKRQHTGAHSILIAAILFTGSLIFRSIDMDICPTFPLGTHLLWHTLNGVVLYYIARALIQNASWQSLNNH